MNQEAPVFRYGVRHIMQGSVKETCRSHNPVMAIQVCPLQPCGRSLNKKNTTDHVEVLGALPNRPAP